MKLEEITVEMLKKALDIYVLAAYQDAPLPITVKSRVMVFREHAGPALMDVLSMEVVERVLSEADCKVVLSWGVRLGNEKYPHMKLTLKRDAEDDFLFVVDTHDSLFELECTGPDALKAQELKDYNRRLKDKIESLWRDADLPSTEES